MLRDDFYKYGIISKLLHVVIIALVIAIYIYAGFNQFSESNFFWRLYLSFSFVLFFVLVIKSIWRLFNKAPMSLTLTIAGSFLQKINLFLIYIALFAMILLHFLGFVFDAYSLYEINVNNKVAYTVFGLVIIPFSFIQLICYILVQYMHADILYLKYICMQYGNLVMIYYFPLLVSLYALQKIVNYILCKKNKPEKLS